MSGSPTHRTASWLSEVLQPVREIYSKYSIKDSFDFVEKLHTYNLKDLKMFSFDVTSLFTSVPVDETITIIMNTIANHNINVGIDLNVLRDLLELCTRDVQFLFNGQLLRQIDGVAMGSCLGPIFADIFVGYLESSICSTIKDKCSAFFRYVDDCFVLCQSDSLAHDLLNAFNSLHPSISYTYERETNDSLNFLDVLCFRRPDGSVRTSVYRKSTWTGLYTNFCSFVPRTYKINLVKSLFSRAHKICSHDSLETELDLIRKVLLDNGYPPFFIDRFKKSDQCSPDKYFGPEKKPIFLRLPFIGDKAAAFARRTLTQSFRTFPAAKVTLFVSTCRIPSASPKDRLPVRLQHNIIYSFVCTCGCKYLGRTGRRLEDRISEHVPKWISNDLRCPPRSTRIPDSAITRHLQVCDSSFDAARTNFKVLFSSPKMNTLKILEALCIKRFSPDLCVQKEHVLSLLLPW
jgi:hypothetical protein